MTILLSKNNYKATQKLSGFFNNFESTNVRYIKTNKHMSKKY